MSQETLYGLDGLENLEESVEDVVERVFEEACGGMGETHVATADRIEWPIKVRVFRRMDASRHANRIAAIALDIAVEGLDEEFGGPDDTKPTDKMKAAAKAFGDAIVAEYKPWACEPTGRVIRVSREEAMQMVGGDE